jgi:hypothetical protein
MHFIKTLHINARSKYRKTYAYLSDIPLYKFRSTSVERCSPTEHIYLLNDVHSSLDLVYVSLATGLIQCGANVLWDN